MLIREYVAEHDRRHRGGSSTTQLFQESSGEALDFFDINTGRKQTFYLS